MTARARHRNRRGLLADCPTTAVARSTAGECAVGFRPIEATAAAGPRGARLYLRPAEFATRGTAGLLSAVQLQKSPAAYGNTISVQGTLAPASGDPAVARGGIAKYIPETVLRWGRETVVIEPGMSRTSWAGCEAGLRASL